MKRLQKSRSWLQWDLNIRITFSFMNDFMAYVWFDFVSVIAYHSFLTLSVVVAVLIVNVCAFSLIISFGCGVNSINVNDMIPSMAPENEFTDIAIFRGGVWVQYQTKMLINPIEWWDFFFSAVPVGMLLVSLAVFHCAWCQKKQCDQHVLYRLTHAFDGTIVIRFPGENLFIESVNRFSRINDTHTAHGSHASAHNHRFSDGFGEQLLSRCDVV